MAEEPNVRRYNDQVSELPHFFGTPKDTMTAATMVDRTDAARLALGWSPEITYNFFSVALQDNAQKWIKCIELINPEFVKTWTWIKPQFLKTFGETINESKVFLMCKELSMKPDENPRDFMIRFSELWVKITDMVPAQVINVPVDPALRTVDYCTGLYAQGSKNKQDGLMKLFYVAGLPHKLLTKVIQKNLPTTLDAYNEAVKLHSLDETPSKNGNGVNIIDWEAEKDTMESDEDFTNQINQIRTGGISGRGNNQGRGYFRGRSQTRGRGGPARGGQRGGSAGGNFSGGNFSGGQQNGNNGNNGNQNGNNFSFEPRPKCKFCQKEGHKQDKCYSRINQNKPCIRADGSQYWPTQRPQQQAPIREGQEEPIIQGAIGPNPSLFQ
jgi:hypothetical protein